MKTITLQGRPEALVLVLFNNLDVMLRPYLALRFAHSKLFTNQTLERGRSVNLGLLKETYARASDNFDEISSSFSVPVSLFSISYSSAELGKPNDRCSTGPGRLQT